MSGNDDSLLPNFDYNFEETSDGYVLEVRDNWEDRLFVFAMSFDEARDLMNQLASYFL